MPSSVPIFQEFPDPRSGNAQRHDLLDILTIAGVASVCGAGSYVDFAAFSVDREPLLREFLSLETGLPSHDTFNRVFRLLDTAAFERAFEAFLSDLGADGTGVLDRGGDDLFARKANRPVMLAAVATYFADPPEPLDTFETTDAEHGRIETRCHRVTNSVDWPFSDRADPGAPRLLGLASLACISTTRDDGAPSTRYYVSSKRLTRERFARAVRIHRAIEKSLHWVLHVTFD